MAGMIKRIRRGWGIGLSQRDTFVWIGTMVIAAQACLIGFLWWKEATKPVTRPSYTSQGGKMVAVGPPVAMGQRAWITHVSADLNPTPQYSRENRRLWSFQPVTVVNRTRDGQWLQVEASLINGQKVSGWILANRIQTDDPTAGARPEPGWVVVVADKGAVLRAMPENNADGYGGVPKGQVLRQIARLKRGGMHDFVLVDNLGPAGRRGQAWVFAPQVAPSAPPPGAKR